MADDAILHDDNTISESKDVDSDSPSTKATTQLTTNSMSTVARMPSSVERMAVDIIEDISQIRTQTAVDINESDLKAQASSGKQKGADTATLINETVNLPVDILQQVQSFQVKYAALIKMADSICTDIRQWKRGNDNARGPVELRRIKGSNGNIYNDPTDKQESVGLKLGNPVALTCFICRRYCDAENNVIRRKTTFWCTECHMPLCKASRVGKDGGRLLSCTEEHQKSNHAIFACNRYHNRGSAVPTEMHVNLHKPSRRTTSRKK